MNQAVQIVQGRCAGRTIQIVENIFYEHVFHFRAAFLFRIIDLCDLLIISINVYVSPFPNPAFLARMMACARSATCSLVRILDT